MRENIIFRIFCLFVLLCALAGCKSTELTSRWRTAEVIIDGMSTDWTDPMATPDDEKRTSVGIINDGEFLYIGLSTADRALQRQITRRGITFWFDRNGGEAKTLGFHYPLGFGGIPSPDRAEGDDRLPPLPEVQQDNSPKELDIYGPSEGEHHRMTLAETGGIDIAFQSANGILFYELKIPLMDNAHHLFAIGTQPGVSIGVGIETGASRPGGGNGGETGGRGGAGRRGAGRGGGRRGGFGEGSGEGGGGGGGGGARPREQLEPLKFWAKVQLAIHDSLR